MHIDPKGQHRRQQVCSWVYDVQLWWLTSTCSDIQQLASSNYGHTLLADIHSSGSQVCLCFFNLLQAKRIHTAPAAYALQWVPHAPYTRALHTIITAPWRHMYIHCPPIARQAGREEMKGVASTSRSSVQCTSATRKQDWIVMNITSQTWIHTAELNNYLETV